MAEIRKQYEYKVLNTARYGVPLASTGDYEERLAEGLNIVGTAGWQLCATTPFLLIFYREKQEAPDV